MATLGEKPELGPPGRYPKAQYLCGLGLPEKPTFQTYGITVFSERNVIQNDFSDSLQLPIRPEYFQQFGIPIFHCSLIW